MPQSAWQFMLCSVLEVRYFGFRHRGIVVGWDGAGQPLVASNSAARSGVCVETLGDFSDGRDVTIAELPHQELHPAILQRVRKKLGSKYDLVSWNCDHFVEWSLGREVKSTQLRDWTAIVACLLFFGAIAARA
jgi:hypothetical protein